MSKKLEVLHFQLLPLLSGVQNVSLNEISQLKNEINFEVACAHPGPFTEVLTDLGIKTHFFNNLKHEINFIADIKVLLELVKFFRLGNYDIVHTHSSKPGILGRISAKIVGVPKVMHTVHGFAFGITKNPFKRFIFYTLEFIAARFTDTILVMNQADYNFCKRMLLIPKRKIVFLANGINDDLFEDKLESNNTLILNYQDKDKVKIGFVGRLCAQKNPILLIDAFHRLPEELKSISKLYFIGDGELMTEMKNKVKEFKLDPFVDFLGWVNNASEHISEFDLFVLPSLYEGMPLSILESMAGKVTVIASSISGNIDLIENNINGKLFKSCSLDELAIVLEELIINEDLRLKLAERAYQDASVKYRLSFHCETLFNIYKKTTSKFE